jgi:hypothetical protein
MRVHPAVDDEDTVHCVTCGARSSSCSPRRFDPRPRGALPCWSMEAPASRGQGQRFCSLHRHAGKVICFCEWYPVLSRGYVRCFYTILALRPKAGWFRTGQALVTSFQTRWRRGWGKVGGGDYTRHPHHAWQIAILTYVARASGAAGQWRRLYFSLHRHDGWCRSDWDYCCRRRGRPEVRERREPHALRSSRGTRRADASFVPVWVGSIHLYGGRSRVDVAKVGIIRCCAACGEERSSLCTVLNIGGN